MTRFSLFTAAVGILFSVTTPSVETVHATRDATVDSRLDDVAFAGELLEQRAVADAITAARERCPRAAILSARTIGQAGDTRVGHQYSTDDLTRYIGQDAAGLSAMATPYTAVSGETVRITAAVEVRCAIW